MVFMQTSKKMIGSPAGSWPRTTLQSIIDSRRMKNNTLPATLLHVKKSSNKVVKYLEAKRSSGKVINNDIQYYRMIFLVDDNFTPFWCIIKNDNASQISFTFWNQLVVGKKVLLAKPKYIGSYKGTHLLDAELIYPFDEAWTALNEIPSLSNVAPDNYYCFRFQTKHFYIEDCYDAKSCNGACDGRYLESCYCLKRKVQTNHVIGLKIIFENDSDDSFQSITCKPYFSNDLTLKLVDSSLLDNGFKDNNNNFVLGQIYDDIITKLENAVATFIVWFKPGKKEEDEVVYFTSGTIASMIIEGNYAKYGAPDPLEVNVPDGNPEEEQNLVDGNPEEEQNLVDGNPEEE